MILGQRRQLFKAPVSLAAEYADWKEDIFVNMASTVLGIILCDCIQLNCAFLWLSASEKP